MSRAETLRRLQALADQAMPEVRRQVEKALDALQASVPLAKIEQALLAHDALKLHDLTASLPLRLRPVVALLEGVFLHGAAAGRLLLPEAARIGWRFDSTNPFAQAAARKSAAQLVTQVTEETRQALRSLVTEAFRNGVTPRELAKQIQPLVGLTTRQAQAVQAARQRAIAQGTSRSAALEQAGAYADTLRRRRSLTIARTEVIRASSEGQQAAWQEAVAKGLLPALSTQLWITTPDDRLCRYCRAMDHRTAVLGAKFQTPLGRVAGPPLHPNCRCAIAVIPASMARRRAA